MSSEANAIDLDREAEDSKLSDEEIAIGDRLRKMRIRSGLRLKDVADAANCSESMLSKIETGHVSPSINMLHRITKILNTNVGALFSPPDHGTPFVHRQGKRPTISTSKGLRMGEGMELESLTPFEIHGQLQAQLHIVEPGGRSDGLISHEGEEVGYVVEGAIELTVENQSTILNSGDSFFFDSSRPHGYRNAGDVVAKIVWVNSPPTY